MKLLLLFCSVALMPAHVFSQEGYWQQEVNYDIHVSLDDTDNSLDGYLKMEYINNSPDSLRFIWIHLWPNAYKNDRTAFSDQLLKNNNTAFYFSAENQKGYINRLNFKINGISAATEDHPQHQDIIKLILPAALPPSGRILIESPFHVKLPYNFSRSGHIGQSYQLTQWYPKPAVYDRKGWHPMPNLDQGEYYSEFGSYKVEIEVPEAYIVASSGMLKNETVDAGIKRMSFSQSDIHDFAWFASKDFIVAHDTLQLQSKVIKVYAYYTDKTAKLWVNSIQYIKKAITTKSDWLGEYPYDIISVVERPGKGEGGMEYPAISLISPASDPVLMDFVINHEVGHNWFYGALASNERDYPWMDEGMNSYYDEKYNLQQHGLEGVTLHTKNQFLNKRLPSDMEDLLLRTVVAVKKDQPVATRSQDFSALNYGLIPYKKTAQWMQLLEKEMGAASFNEMMQQYYTTWKFKHPYPEDFKAIAEKAYDKNADSIFVLLNKKGRLAPGEKKDIKLMSFFSFKETDKHNYLFIAPAIGYNFYDKLMPGLMIHNYTLPLPRFTFFAAPLYGTGSKKINGIGRISYTWFPGNNGQKLEIGIAGSRFSGDSFTDSTNSTHYLDFTRVVPTVKFTFANKDATSSASKYIMWKSYLIQERSYLFTRDTINQNYIISYPVSSRYIHQLSLVINNYRKLYPYSASLVTEKGDGFIKTGFTGNYYFNYAKGGGLNVRLFAGKFFYTTDRLTSRYKTYQYYLNMTGANGYEDYTYSNYFIGRSEFEGLLSQQIMIKDGGFKVRTDLLSNKFGKTDDWLSAANFTTDVPKTIFPVPLKLFADIGTYAEAWKKDAQTGKFVFDAGLQLSLLKNIINIYIPVIYSREYRDYFKSYIPEKRFRKNIAFSIDIQNISIRKFFPQSPF